MALDLVTNKVTTSTVIPRRRVIRENVLYSLRLPLPHGEDLGCGTDLGLESEDARLANQLPHLQYPQSGGMGCGYLV